MCEHRFYQEGCYSTCLNCGYTVPTLDCTFETTSYQQAHCPLQSVYSRSKRFSLLIKTLLHPFPTKADEPMLKYFVKNKIRPPVSKIIDVMRGSGLSDKRYSSIHTFAQLFSSDYKKMDIPNVFQLEKTLLILFRDFESDYYEKYQSHLAYSLAIDFLLRRCGLEYLLQFVKRTKCKRRLKKYRTRVKELYPGVKISFE